MRYSEEIYNEVRNEGKLQALFELLKKGIISIKQAAESLNISEEAFKNKLDEYGLEA